MKRKLKISDLAVARHVAFTNKLNKQANQVFAYLMAQLKKEIYQNLRKDKLAKSEDPIDEGLEAGWTGEINSVNIDISEVVGASIDKYLQALRWMMLGNYAGKGAREAAEKIGLIGKVVPGILQSSYLNAIDAHREHHADLTEEEAPEMPKKIIKASFDKILQRSDKFLKQALQQMKLNIVGSFERIIEAKNYANIAQAHSEAHDAAPEADPAYAVSEAANRLSNVLSLHKIGRELNLVNRKNMTSFARLVDSEVNLSAATASHQCMMEIHGRSDDSVRVVWIAFEDEKTCSFCENASRHKTGEFKFYSVSDFKPSGHNYGKKKSEWELTIPGAHINCRCRLVYVPRGFEIDKIGTISKKK